MENVTMVTMMDSVPLDVDKIRQLRLGKGLSIAEAARRAGMNSRQHWHAVETGVNVDVRLSLLESIARALDVDPGDLLRRAK